MIAMSGNVTNPSGSTSTSSSRTGVRRPRSSSDVDAYSEEESNDMVETNHNYNHPVEPINDDDNDDKNDIMDDENDEYLVSCRCESAKVISTLLSCLRNVAISASSGGKRNDGHHHNTSLIRSTQNVSTYSVRSSRRNHNTTSSSSSSLQPVTVYCSATNLTFHIGSSSKQIQASVDIPANLFSDYSVATKEEQDHNNGGGGDGGEFCINLITLLECLHCLGTQNLDTTKLCFSYNMTQELFKLELLEELSGILSTASIPGMLSPDSNDDDHDDDYNDDHIHQSRPRRLYSLAHAFRQSEKYVRIIIQSESLNELILELDYIAGGTMANVTFDHHEFRISVKGYLGECQIVLPTRGPHIISWEGPDTDRNSTSTTNGVMNDVVVVPTPPTWSYPLHAFMESMRGLEIADETCVTINRAGMMAIQHQVIQPDQTTTSDVVTPSFVDFILCCMVEEEEEEEEGDDDDNQEEGDENENDPTTAVDNNPLSVSGARLFGSLAIEEEEEEDDDDDASTEIKAAAVSRNIKDRFANADRQSLRRRQRTVQTMTTVPKTHATKKSRRLLPHTEASNVVTSIHAKARRNNDTSTRQQFHLDDERDRDDESDDDDDDDDEDMEVALVLSGRAPNVSPSRNRNRRMNHRRTRCAIYDDDDEDGSSSPELVYGQQH